jgi:class 3 adenylate cyclase/CHASE2 domain-containing sensor protein
MKKYLFSYRQLRNGLFLLISFLTGFLFLGSTNFLEFLFTDIKFILTSYLSTKEDYSDHIAVILMDAHSEEVLQVPAGSKWRQFHPQLLKVVNDSGALLVVFDIEFYERDKQWDYGLAKSFTQSGNVVSGEMVPNGTEKTLQEALYAIGSLNVKVYRDISRWVYVHPEENKRLALSVLVAGEYLKRMDKINGLSSFPSNISKDKKGKDGFWINFNEKSDYFPTFSYVDVLLADRERINDKNKTPLSIFQDKIVLIGLDVLGSDRRVFPNTMGRKLAGVYGHAYAIETLLGNNIFTKTALWLDAVLLVLLLLIFHIFLRQKTRWKRTIFLLVFSIFVFCVVFFLFSRTDLWINYSGFFISTWVLLSINWIYDRAVLDSYIKKVINFELPVLDIIRHEKRMAGGQIRKDICILCADIRGYTEFVTRNDPKIVVQVITEYLAPMGKIIADLDGYINDVIGDEIIAVFGFPLKEEQKNLRAVKAALSMLAECDRLKTSWKERNIPAIKDIGIGIDAGPVTLTEIGVKTKSQFEIIGNSANGASRVQKLTKTLKKRLLISEEVFQSLGENESLKGSFQLIKKATIRGQGVRNIFGEREV